MLVNKQKRKIRVRFRVNKYEIWICFLPRSQNLSILYQNELHRNVQFVLSTIFIVTWWRHQMETFSTLLAICAENSPVPGEFPAQRPVTRSFDVFFDLRPNKLLSKQSWGWWSETPSSSLWRHRNEITDCVWIDETNSLKFPLTLVSCCPPSWIQWIRLRGWFHGFANPDLVSENPA